MKLKLITLLIILSFSCKKENEPSTAPGPDLNPVQKEEIIELKTSFGDMYIWLYKATPLHRDNFLKLAKQDYYDGTTFHRIIANFMIQGGDPNSKDNDKNNDGTGGPGYTIPAEIFSDIKHQRGALAAARTNNPQKASSGSQFYICHSTSGTAGLNGNYTVYGMVMKGVEVVDSIVIQPKTSGNNRPITDIPMDVNVIEKTQQEIEAEYNYTDFR
jgi:cyclophilin family peptidyl-prolyl cis-trans isomerase